MPVQGPTGTARPGWTPDQLAQVGARGSLTPRRSIMASRSAVCVALMLAFAPTAAANGIRNVDQPGQGTFTSLQAAIDAASDGDLLLVASGTYASATIDGKSLAIVAMPSLGSKKTGGLTIKNLAAGQRVLLVGLQASNASGPGLTLTNDSGFVRIHGCTITGGKTPTWPPDVATFPGVGIVNCPQVVFASCTVKGGEVGWWSGEQPVAGAPGIRSVDSSIALFDTTSEGGEGSYESAPSGGAGGAGLALSGWG